MTPKEKAQELVEKFKPFAHAEWDEWDGYNEKTNKENSEECALIAVDEILKVVAPIIDMNEKYFQELRADQTEYYWQQVKTEIEKL
jgi:hypothetical protein